MGFSTNVRILPRPETEDNLVSSPINEQETFEAYRDDSASNFCYTQIRNDYYAVAWHSQIPASECRPSTTITDLRQHVSASNGFIILAISFILLLASLPPVAEGGSCTRRRVVHTIRWRRCIPKRVLTFACHGSCHGASLISPRDQTTVVRRCSCCSPTDYEEGTITLRCPRPNGRSGYRRATVNVNIPTSCRCRPCDSVTTIRAAEFLS